MPNSLRTLIDRLHGNNICPTGEELADALWLALRMGELEAAQITREQVDEEKVPPTTPTKPSAELIPPSQPVSSTPIKVPAEEQRIPICVEASPTAATPATAADEEKPSVGARPFRAPAVPALSDSLGLNRALRPLMRRVPSRSRHILDETATAERYADRGLWLPIFKGRPERWLELALVIDASPSMRLWHPTLAELYQLLARHGAFRDVRRWQLSVDTRGKPVLSKSSADTPRYPEELLHPEGSRLVIVVSDYAAPPWYRGAYDRWLRLWSRNQPLTLLHLLPPRFWLRGGLQRTRLAQFRALAPGLPNPQLLPDITKLPVDPVFLPVFTLEPESVGLWARLLAGSGETRSPGVVLDRTVVSLPPGSGQEMTVQERLRYFRSNASPEAQTLARYCAALPLTLPVMRLLQAEMLPQSRQVHLAEVFFSGLLLRKNPQETDPEWFIYEFRPGLRDKLLDTLRAPLILDIHQRLSEAVRRNLGRIADFPAFIPDLLAEGGLILDERSLPFAEVGVTVLHRLGGHYVERAERLADEIEKFRAAASARLGVDQAARVAPSSEPPPKPSKAPIPNLHDTLEDGSPGPAMVWLPGGQFIMGDDNGYEWEKPAHDVAVSAFSIGQYPVTFEEYDKFCEATRRRKPKDYGWGRGTRPAVDISWSDAAAYCEWLSQQTGESYRLPTEAEWEYACRATSSTRYCYGDDEQRLGEYAWYLSNARGQTHPVGEKESNAWQLYDMHGNVWEWVRDWYEAYSKAFEQEPSGPESGANRVIRGGSWGYGAYFCRSASRNVGPPALRYGNLGFRLARTGAWPSYPLTLEPFQIFRDRLKKGPAAPEMIYLPGGTFKMGDIQGKAYKDERPVHEVTLDAFAIGRYPVTVGEYMRFVQAAPSHAPEWLEKYSQYHIETGTDDYYRQVGMSLENLEHPIVGISWHDASAYCEWLSEQTGERYSLPTEAEWEYACRASSETEYFFGDDERLLEEYAWYSKNSEWKIHPVEEKRANRWGLHDISGNVWEWVRDWYGVYSSESQHNPSGPESGARRVCRGGGWFDPAVDCRSAYRVRSDPAYRYDFLGFRLARRV
ncbi:MAG: formylglycine-generating enzyme family protein [Candidatus Competibacteraceae bacterium]